MNNSARTWRSIFMVTVAAMVMSSIAVTPAHAATTTAAAVPATGLTAYMGVFRATNSPDYKGWATIDSLPDCAMGYNGVACAVAVPATVTAYRWSATDGWQKTSRPQGSRVYVYPYGGAWRWTWSSDRGWLAVQAGSIVISYPSRDIVGFGCNC